MFARVNSMGLFGIDSYMVRVEVDYGQGLPRVELVGLPDAAVSESKNRVRSAVKNSGFQFPPSRITINLSPADIRKEGPLYDLPILIAILKAGHQLKADTDDCAFIGELSLDGMVRHVNGALPMIDAEGMKPLKTAVEEINRGLLTYDNPVEQEDHN